MKWFKKLFGICDHKWENIQIITIFLIDDYGRRISQNPHHLQYIQQCQKCGKMRKFNTA